MTAFKLNITKLKENVNNYKKNVNYCKSDITSIYDNLKNANAGWNDSVATSFVNEIKNDKYKLDDYFEKMDSLYKQVEFLTLSFDNLLAKYRYNKVSTISYNDDYYSGCIQNFKNVISNLDSALAYLDSCNFKATFPEIYKVYQLKTEIKKIKIDIDNLINSIMVFKREVDKILSDVNSNIGKIEDISLDIDVKTYNWKLVEIDTNN